MSSCCSPAKKNCPSGASVTDSVKEYYGKRLTGSSDLKTNACTTSNVGKWPKHIREAISQCHDEVQSKYYGCGLTIPESLIGVHVLDLGSGSGLDCFVLSKLVGEGGSVVGIDMTDEQLAVANKHVDYHMEKFGLPKPNVRFVKGYIERLGEAGLEDNSFDIVVSNCVINLSPDKKSVLKEAFRVLKSGGELYFSDVYSDRAVPEEAKKDEVLWGECVSGAMVWSELVQYAQEVGFEEPRLVTASGYSIEDEKLKKIQEKLGGAQFCSATYRIVKIGDDKARDAKPMKVIYKGDILGFEKRLEFDAFNVFEAGIPKQVASPLAKILKGTRYANHFNFESTDGEEKETNGASKVSLVNPFPHITKTQPLSKGGCCS
ncbi:arsenite methyltransferase-like [Oscarella lobularis]|uniref:arsenite methyltransferase-like n=1 Tax=Oscarella lobularis TaxID=121494 RepID=UPI0033137764